MRRLLKVSLVTLLGLVVAAATWFTIGTTRAIRDVRADEKLIERVLERVRPRRFEVLRASDPIPAADIRLAWFLSNTGELGEFLKLFFYGDSGPPWEPGRDVLLEVVYRMPEPPRRACRRMAGALGMHADACTPMSGGPGLLIRRAEFGPGVSGFVEASERLITPTGEVLAGDEAEFVEGRVVSAVEVVAGTRR